MNRRQDPADRAEVQAWRQCLADRDSAKAAHALADRARIDNLRGELSSLEELELARWRAEARLDDVREDLDATEPALVKIRSFLACEAAALIAALAPSPAPTLASVDDLQAHTAALLAHADAARRTATAIARVQAAWAAAHAALAIVRAERKAAALPEPVIREFGTAPHSIETALPWTMPAKPHRSGAHVSIDRLERLRAERTYSAENEVVKVLTGAPSKEVVARATAQTRGAERAATRAAEIASGSRP